MGGESVEPYQQGGALEPKDHTIVLTRGLLDQILTSVFNKARNSADPASSIQQPSTSTSNDSTLSLIRNDLQAKYAGSPIYTLNGFNYTAWRSHMLSDAHIVGVQDIIERKQETPPKTLSPIEQQNWHVKNTMLHTQFYQSLSLNAKQRLGDLNGDSAYALWIHVTAEYSISLAEGRLSLVRELMSLSVHNNDYLTSLRKFRQLLCLA